MKKLYTLLAVLTAGALSLTVFTSCEKALETKVYGQIVPESFFKTESDLEAAVRGARP